MTDREEQTAISHSRGSGADIKLCQKRNQIVGVNHKRRGDADSDSRRGEYLKTIILVGAFILFHLVISLIPVQAHQEVKVGIYQNRPLCFTDQKGQAQGIYIDILNQVARREKWEITYVDDTWDNGIKSLKEGRIDLLCGIAYTEERSNRFNFNTENVLIDWGQIYLPKNSDIQSVFDLDGRKVATVSGGILLKSFADMLKTFDVTCLFVEVGDPVDVLEMIDQGKADAGTVLRLNGLKFAPGYSVKPSPIIFAPLQLRFAAPMSGNLNLLNVLDHHLLEMKRSPKSVYFESMDRWLELPRKSERLSPWLLWLIVGVILFVVLLIAASVLLKRQVNSRTAELSVSNKELQLQISETKQAEEALRDSEEKFRLLAENANEGIFIIQNDRYCYVNNYGADLMGKTKDQVLSGELVEFVHEEDRDIILQRLRRRLKGEKVDDVVEHRIIRDRNQIRWIETKGTLTSWEGSPATLAFARDITERKEAEEENEKLQAQLQQSRKMEAIGTLAGGIAHDFNNLLQAINGYTQMMLLDRTEKDADYNKLISIIKSSERAAQLIQQLLLFSRKQETEKKPVGLNREVESVRTELERIIPQTVDIELHCGVGLWNVNADPIQIAQVLLNLGKNAVDAMPDGGRLVMETENVMLDEEDTRNHIGATPGKYVLLKVSDTGQGMDEEIVEHIFEPFYTTKDVGKGTGLGLASAYGIIKGHGGFITCRSELGRGTTFQIYLPAIKVKEDRSGVYSSEILPKGRAETILLVDSVDSVRDVGARLLQHFGYTVLNASTAEEALVIYVDGKDKIDLVILDIETPMMGGSKCLSEVLSIHPKAKVVVVSGYSFDERVVEILEQGAAGYVEKPYRLTELLTMVRSLLDEGE